MATKWLVKNFAFELGADLVGFGDIGRCRNAPLMMSPQGILPTARTVIVMGIHHPDACIERGGETHPQEIGPYSVQYLMNSRLDEMSYRLATFLERQGHGAIPIASSNIWRYNQYKDLKAVFAPDVSHIYMAVVAGLADMGFNGLAISPQYGARNRFVTVITDAVIEPDPLIPPGSVCDRCMLCRRHCPSKALSKEISGENVLKIDGNEYRFPGKNLWRCAWGEHFDLDLDLPIPEQVTEQVIIDGVKKHGVRSGEMGQCLKFCVPKPVRTFDKAYSKTPMRRYGAESDEMTTRAAADQLLSRLFVRGADDVIVSTAEQLEAKGIHLDAILPGAKSAITVAATCSPAADNEEFRFGAQYQVDSLCYDLTRQIERLGHRSLMSIQRSGSHCDCQEDANPTDAILAGQAGLGDRRVFANTVITRAALAPQRLTGAGVDTGLDFGNAKTDITGHLADFARSLGADLVGVASASRIDELAAQLRPVFEEDEILDATDRSIRFTPWDPVVTGRKRRVKTASDWMEGARSVFVFGLRYHKEVLRWATRPPAEAVGPYAFETYETNWLGATIGYQLVNRLEALGYAGVLAADLTGTDSVTANPRGPQADLFTNRFAGVAAGLGHLTTSGHLATDEFGIRQRLIAIVTDAPLRPSPLRAASDDRNLCAKCDEPCIGSCPTHAISTTRISVVCEGHQYGFNKTDPKLCDWSKRYALMGDSGFKYLGSPTDVAPGDTVTDSALADALRHHDPIKKYRPVVAEPCVINCPYAVESAGGKDQ